MQYEVVINLTVAKLVEHPEDGYWRRPGPQSLPRPRTPWTHISLVLPCFEPFYFWHLLRFWVHRGHRGHALHGGRGHRGPSLFALLLSHFTFLPGTSQWKKRKLAIRRKPFFHLYFLVFLWISVSLQMKSKRQIIHPALWRFDEFYSLVVKITWIRVLKIVFSRKIGTTNSAWRIAAEPVGGV